MPRIILLDRDAVIARCQCPHCGARKYEGCHSAFLDREMVNEVHRGRRELAHATPVERRTVA